MQTKNKKKQKKTKNEEKKKAKKVHLSWVDQGKILYK